MASLRWSETGRAAEREGEDLQARAEKLDLELAVRDRGQLPDQRVHPLFGHHAKALLVDVDAAGLYGLN
jgi:hypothetical protein